MECPIIDASPGLPRRAPRPPNCMAVEPLGAPAAGTMVETVEGQVKRNPGNRGEPSCCLCRADGRWAADLDHMGECR